MRGQMGRLIDFMHGRIRARSPSDALHIAAFENDLDKIEFLVTQKGVNVDTEVATIMGASVRQTPLFLAIQEGNLDAARLLIELGANIDAVNKRGITPLMSAAFYGDDRLISKLLDLGASPNFVRTGDRATALSFCTLANDKSDSIAKIAKNLIDAGAEVDAPADSPQSVLMLAARENLAALAALLLESGADPERRCKLKWAMDWTALDHAINEESHEVEGILRAVTKAVPIATPNCVV